MISALQELRRVARGILGSDAYDRYVHHHRIAGCPGQPMGEKEFWRDRYSRQDGDPQGRCC